MQQQAAAAEVLLMPDMLKAARLSEESGRRYVYLEASNQARDIQGERVMAKALADSADYYLKFGNLDLDHITQLGASKGIQDYMSFEIGRPAEVQVRDGGRTMVKGEIFQGDAPVAECANRFWDSVTKLTPPQRWYPSVAGAIRDKGTEFDPETRTSSTIIKAVRWTNIGFSKTPVNPTVPSVSTVPMDMLMKCWGPAGLNLSKALEAGYGTDSATLSGGAALRTQSLDHHVQSYWDFRDKMAAALRSRKVQPAPEALAAHACAHMGCGQAEAAEWTGRFLGDLARDRSRNRKH